MKSCKSRIVLLALFLLLPEWVAAQNPSRVTVRASGVAMGTDIAVTKQNALYDAKRNALNEAGIGERVQSISVVVLGDTTLLMKNSVLEVGLLELDGKVHVKEAKYEGRLEDIDNSDQVIINCTIVAEVEIEETSVDETFQFRLDGLKSVYRDGELVTMDITPFADSGCYMRVFWFNDLPSGAVTGAELYPGNIYNDLKINYEEVFRFPELSKEYYKEGMEPHRMRAHIQPDNSEGVALFFFVALKKKIRYNGHNYSYEEFINWLMKIPANERYVVCYPVKIIK